MVRSTPPEVPTRLDVGVTSLAAWTWGGESSLPLVIGVHDLAGNGLWWGDLAAACADRLRFAALDLRGRGGSSTLGATSSLLHHIEDVWSMADALAATHFLIAGHGTGAIVALQVAVDSPTRVDGIALFDGPPVVANDDVGNPGRIDPGVAGAGTTHAHRDEHLRTGLAAGWLPATGLTRNARLALTADLVGSGFAWRVQLDRRAIARDLADFVAWSLSGGIPTAPTFAVRAAHGHRPDDPPLDLAIATAATTIVATTHAGLLLDPAAVPLVADALVDGFGAA